MKRAGGYGKLFIIPSNQIVLNGLFVSDTH